MSNEKIFLVRVTVSLLPKVKKALQRTSEPIERNTVITVKESKITLHALNNEYINQACRAAGVSNFKDAEITSFVKLREANGLQAFERGLG